MVFGPTFREKKGCFELLWWSLLMTSSQSQFYSMDVAAGLGAGECDCQPCFELTHPEIPDHFHTFNR